MKNLGTVPLLLALAGGCGSTAVESAPPVQRATAPRPAPPPLEFVGVVTTRDSQVVAAEFEGRVVTLYVRGGQRVRAGEPIVKLDDSQVRKQLAGAIAAVDAARAEMGRAGVEVRAARREMRLERRLYRRGAVARERIRQAGFDGGRAGAGFGAVAAQYRQAVAERQQLEQHLARATLVAPIDGVVSMIRVKEGEVARPGTPVARVFDPRDLWVRFAVDNEHRAQVREGTRVAAVVPTTGAKFDAVVRSVSTDLEPPLQFIVADADVDDHNVDGETVGVGVVGRVRVLEHSPEQPLAPASP
ncbi:MAG TPA: efflux RND transporter periplasmic adaptor subunit [Candidatus Acidoferrum sp.]|nr:efflux RND transporter periplasmic adaptor subunit [Candidatus Acidoferrum sp.]